ncbi:MAG: DUF4338 domain-containing protein [Oscillospiraceae bacterium]|nr:DUF4338 domain-containing protein [Oscillospiraceae bacterium]
MTPNRTIPFRPKLEGEFRTRFYTVVQQINEDTKTSELEEIIAQEVHWTEHECTVNLVQRKKYRAVWMLLRDLMRASWKACYREGVLEMRMPTLDKNELEGSSLSEKKSLLRGWMQDSRLERLQIYSDFINRMEKDTATKKSISHLIADGEELYARLRAISNNEIKIGDAIKPYLQLVQENERDEYTGQKLSDIWRYFRLTWSTPAETTPGRTMQYLIRDAAHPNHAVMGIASLENTAVQITCRDDYIGWNAPSFIDKLKAEGNHTTTRNAFKKLLEYLDDGIQGIDYFDLCASADIDNPSEDVIRKLQYIALTAEEERQELLKAYQSGNAEAMSEEKSELGSISKEIEQALYRRKRADQLGKLLGAKKALTDLISNDKFEDLWKTFCDSDNGKSHIRTSLIAQKTKHIGSSMMELNVCGAIPPYNEILGGKLVALLATSPQVISDYRDRYSGKKSEIASRLKGEDVYRPADLVYIGTTSLYYVGSSQYNRLKIPGSLFNSTHDVKWEKLGKTVGFGTLHISKATTMCLTEATSDGFSRINHVFGEGASPKMRLMTMAIRELLESDENDTKEFSKHAMSRIVYGAELASNTRDYLLGIDESPSYYFNTNDCQSETQKIVDFWLNRWVASRLNYTPIFERIRCFDKKHFLVSTDLKKASEWKFEKLKEPEKMEQIQHSKAGLDSIRDFYRGSSGYADFMDYGFLSKVHVATDLDSSIVEAVNAGKDVVLTGNPGDGKTHIIRILQEQLSTLKVNPIIELDASTMTNKAIYEKWLSARETSHPFVIAINAAVLLALAQEFPSFSPIVDAKEQMISAIVFHDEQIENDKVSVFDLSKRETLEPSVVKSVILNMTKAEHFVQCETCQFKELCPAIKNAQLIQNDLFQERLNVILTQVALQGYHATLRELQSFVSFLIFGNRNCATLTTTSGQDEYDLCNLIYQGDGRLFGAVRGAFDPSKVSHPVWDEKILMNTLEVESWIPDYNVSPEALNLNNTELFALRKRQFYFFNSHGNVLLDISDDAVIKFQHFLGMEDKSIIKDLIQKLNAFFGTSSTNSELEIWMSHRYNNAPRKILISTGKMKRSDFRIGHPRLNSVMENGIKMVENYVRLEKKDAPEIFLKIDFDMYNFLLEAERGVPVLLMESDTVKKVWRFVEQLQSEKALETEEDVTLSLFDVQGKKEVTVTIDRESKCYSSITVRKSHN